MGYKESAGSMDPTITPQSMFGGDHELLKNKSDQALMCDELSRDNRSRRNSFGVFSIMDSNQDICDEARDTQREGRKGCPAGFFPSMRPVSAGAQINILINVCVYYNNILKNTIIV